MPSGAQPVSETDESETVAPEIVPALAPLYPEAPRAEGAGESEVREAGDLLATPRSAGRTVHSLAAELTVPPTAVGTAAAVSVDRPRDADDTQTLSPAPPVPAEEELTLEGSAAPGEKQGGGTRDATVAADITPEDTSEMVAPLRQTASPASPGERSESSRQPREVLPAPERPVVRALHSSDSATREDASLEPADAKVSPSMSSRAVPDLDVRPLERVSARGATAVMPAEEQVIRPLTPNLDSVGAQHPEVAEPDVAPEVIIDSVQIEIVESPSPAPRVVPTSRRRASSKRGSRSSPGLNSKLRFGLGQM
jgi:hypothetical protein